ncbi:cysteine dioxygenase [Dermatophilaceae bacterium Soc4.6]
MPTSTRHRALVHSSAPDLERLARRYALNPNLGVLLPDEGERTWARLADHDGAEVWLISWPEGGETGWHDHDGSLGSFAVASGAVVEQTWGGGRVHARRLVDGESRAFGESHVHNVRGAAAGRSLTVHAYAPRLTTTTSHELAADGPRAVSATHEGADW